MTAYALIFVALRCLIFVCWQSLNLHDKSPGGRAFRCVTSENFCLHCLRLTRIFNSKTPFIDRQRFYNVNKRITSTILLDYYIYYYRQLFVILYLPCLYLYSFFAPQAYSKMVKLIEKKIILRIATIN